MSIESSPVKVIDTRPDFTDVDARSTRDSQTWSRTRTLDKPPVSRFIKDLAFALDSTPVFANQSVDTVLIDRLRRDALLDAKQLKLPVIKAAETPATTPEKPVAPRKNRLQKALGRVAAPRSRTQPTPAPKAPSVQKVETLPTPALPSVSEHLSTADLMTPDAPTWEETEIILEDYHVDSADQILTAEYMTPDAPVLEEEAIFHSTDFVNKIHVPTEPEEPRENLATVSQLARRREVLRHRSLKSRLPALLGAASLLAGSVFGITADNHIKAVSHASVMPAATSIEQLQEQVAASQAVAPTLEAPAPIAAATAIPSQKLSGEAAPAAVVSTPAPAPQPAPAPVTKAPTRQHKGPSARGTKPNHGQRQGQKGPRHDNAPAHENSPSNVYIVTPGAGDPTADFAVSEYVRKGIIPPGAQIIRNMYPALIAPGGATQNSLQIGKDGLKNIISSLPPGVRATSLGFSEGSMVNDVANNELTQENNGSVPNIHFRDDGAPDAPTGLMRSPQYEMFKPFVQGVLGLEPVQMDPRAKVEMHNNSGDVYGTNFDGRWTKIIKNFAGPGPESGLKMHQIIGADEKPVQTIKKGNVIERIYGDPQPVPADAELLEGPYIAPEVNPLAPMPAGGDMSAILGPNGQPPAPDAPQPPVRDALTGVPAAPPAPESERSMMPSFPGEQACPGGYFTPGDAPC